MKAFSPAGLAVKAFFGFGAKTFGNPSGATSGNGSTNPQPPPPVTGLNVVITSDHIAAQPGTANGVNLSDLLTPTQTTDWVNGVYDTLNLSGGGVPARGYWVISGASDFAGGGATPGFVFDVMPGALAVTINIDAHLLRFYGGGGPGGVGSGFNNGAQGGAAIRINNADTVDVNISLTFGALSGRIYAGGGGGGGSIASLMGGGGGAAGWNPGQAGLSAQPGGIYDTANGGTGLTTVPGGTGGVANSPHGGSGGQMGQAGIAGASGTGGAAGLAAISNGITTYTVLSGAGFIIGALT